ncbi:hypothetical protein [Xanthocytophaga agilis]|uniref:Uncharacterized protein n=1 Tax=Xanthocytophaga agilis TaxID=3048010 RepID=A0AAE3R5R2_9BACT|nr:hypothetical protein [Xanthocytophaga agilis]MDJ1501909.1 hypothetical protein [Xanthocytophaga agilis]
MFKRIYNYVPLVIGALLALSSCKDDDDDKIKTYSSLVEVTNSSLQFDKYNMNLLFSVDGGQTFVDYPLIKPGQKYQVKVHNSGSDWFSAGADLTTDDHYTFDWSGSDPKPVGTGDSGVAEFVAGKNNSVLLKVSDACPYSASDWAGTYSASEDGGNAYPVTLTADPSVPNRFVLDNFYDSELTAYIDFDPTTGTVKFPNQTTGGEDITASSGVYKSCTGEIIIKLHFDGGDWYYSLTKD